MEKVPLRQISAQFGVNKSTVSNHRRLCMGLAPGVEREASSNTRNEDAAAPSKLAAVIAQLPSREEIGDRIGGIADRLEEISAACQKDGSMALSITSLDKMRGALDSLARIAGHVGGSATQVNVGVAVSISASDIANALASRLSTVSACEIIEATADEC